MCKNLGSKRPVSMEASIVLGCAFDLGDGYAIKPPAVRQVIEYGQSDYYRVVGLLTAISSDCKAALEDMGIDWCKVSDFEMFVMATHSLSTDESSILLSPAIDFTALELYANESGKAELRDRDGNVVIDEARQQAISSYLCKLHNIQKKPEFPSNDFARMMLLEESRTEAARAKGRADKDILYPLISFVANAPGSKYDYATSLDLPISTFMDCVSRLRIIDEASALRSACYNGWVDTSKLDRELLDVFREIKPPKPREVIKT